MFSAITISGSKVSLVIFERSTDKLGQNNLNSACSLSSMFQFRTVFVEPLNILIIVGNRLGFWCIF